VLEPGAVATGSRIYLEFISIVNELAGQHNVRLDPVATAPGSDTHSRNRNAICARALAQAQTASLDQTLIAGRDAASFAPAITFTTGLSQAITGLRK
jgi:hypothetical protein